MTGPAEARRGGKREPLRGASVGEPWDEYDPDDDFDGVDDDACEEDCGRWLNGRLSPQCRLAGTEWCDWECPIGLSRAALRDPAARADGGGA